MEFKLHPDENIHQRWERNAELYPDKDAIIFWKTGEEPYRWTFSGLLRASEKYMHYLISKGITPGSVCGLIIRHNKEFYPLYIAVSRIGAIPAVLAYPNSRIHPEKFRQGLEGMSSRSGLDFILTESSLRDTVQPLVTKTGSTIKGLLFPLDDASEIINGIKLIIPDSSSEDPFLLQHSSGTTGLQKPVLLSHRAVLNHVLNYSSSIDLTENDKVVSWLPLYHDMGLIAAFHLPLIYGIPSVQLDTFEWVMIPSILPEAIHKEKGTICWLPNFSLNIMADKIRDDEMEGISLESLRLIINCSEPVRAESHTKFSERFTSYGFSKNALSACYAMAETTYAVTQTEPGIPPLTLSVDRKELANGKVIPAENNSSRACVSSGKLIPGCKIKIINDSGFELNEGEAGEILIQSDSMFEGYRNYPEKTNEVLIEGWFHSGDIGFLWQGEYYIIGRKKDIIIVAGNNIYPEDIEDAVSSVEGVIPGRVVAFGDYDEILGSEQISIIAETFLESEEKKNLEYEIKKAGMSIDITIRNIYLVPPRWLIKSSAGKPGRSANKERIKKEFKEADAL